jgi:hypothetical protein
MAMTEQDDTMAAAENLPENPQVSTDHTTASALGADADTTWVPADPATVDAYAWSEGDEPDDDQRHPWTRVLAIAAGVLALGTVAAVVVAANGRHGNDLHGSALPVTVHSSAAAPVLSAPVVTTVTVAPPSKTMDIAPPTTAALVIDTDPIATDFYLDKLRRHGWTGDSARAITLGYRACAIMAEYPKMTAYDVARQLASETEIPIDMTNEIKLEAQAYYCSQYAGR